ncbi:hypothetical protein [Flavobacterium chilense]|uniref:Uncharacterized protein n=1 Tax=Flavobacterium chilense TaxID=946677 RepID=A0A1M7AHL8_9FLAO|nr:hypothetical protein [Flavobacterium chilense]SHL42105.1 hypothetical protein SAMN05444484_1011436 [Flavobacterium chilense]
MKKIKRLNCEKIIYIFTLISFILFLVFFINNYKKTVILEKERIRINREIYLKQVISKKKEKEFIEEEEERNFIEKSKNVRN